MADSILSEDTLISTATLESGDTIDLNGYSLIIDADAVSTPVTLVNPGGAACKLEFRNGGRIKLNATLPGSIYPWSNPANPLPEANYAAGFIANASVEIQIGAFPLGGGAAILPTATRSGAFWAKVTSSSSSSTLRFDRDFPCHVGDILQNITIYDSFQKCTVTAYDAGTRTATLSPNPSRRIAGDVWILCHGAIAVNRTVSASSIDFLTANMTCGSLFLNGVESSNSGGCFGFRSRFLVADRIVYAPSTKVWQGWAFVGSGSARVGQYAGTIPFGTYSGGHGFAGFNSFRASEIATGVVGPDPNNIAQSMGFVSIGNGIAAGNYQQLVVTPGLFRVRGVELRNMPTLAGNTQAIVFEAASVAGTEISDSQVEISGSVSRTARTDFPADTDLPDAFYHAPNAADAVTWRYEDRWVRKGETLRMRARWMPAGAASAASVAIAELATWWPDLWQLGAEAPSKAEFAAGMEQLKWHDGSVEWRNDTGEDCQVRVWECVSGDTLGGYLRVWEATGGAM